MTISSKPSGSGPVAGSPPGARGRARAGDRHAAALALLTVLALVVGTAVYALLEWRPEPSGEAPAWLGWPLLVATASTAAVGILLLARVLRDARRIERLNEGLEWRTRQAEEAALARDEFISAMAHELRTPLVAIKMSAELLRENPDRGGAAGERRGLEDIAASAGHMLDLLDDTADVARITSGRLRLRPARVNLGALAIAVVDGLQPLAGERGIELKLAADETVGDVYLDPARLRQVIINFLTNALKFTPPGGSVELRISRHRPASFAIAVRDDGVGIPRESLSALFDGAGSAGNGLPRPIREQDSTSGLGLRLTKRIVEAMGGRVGVESEPGSGSTFYAVLPRSDHERDGDTAGAGPWSGGVGLGVDPARPRHRPRRRGLNSLGRRRPSPPV